MDIAFLKGFNADFDRYYRRCVAFAKSYTYDTAQSECFAAEAREFDTLKSEKS